MYALWYLLTWKLRSFEGEVRGERLIGRTIIDGVVDGEFCVEVSFASRSQTAPGDQISHFRFIPDDISLGFVLRFNGTSSSFSSSFSSIKRVTLLAGIINKTSKYRNNIFNDEKSRLNNL